MKTITIVYEITDHEAFKKVSPFGLEHNGLKSFAVGMGNVMDHADALEDQLIGLMVQPVQPPSELS